MLEELKYYWDDDCELPDEFSSLNQDTLYKVCLNDRLIEMSKNRSPNGNFSNFQKSGVI